MWQKALADKVLGEGKYDVLDEMKGSDLEYIEYEQLMPFRQSGQEGFLYHMHGLCIR